MVRHSRREIGITLIEVLVVIFIVAILASLAIPSFLDSIRNQRVKGAAENLAAALQNTKAETIKTNQVISLVFKPATINTAHSSWCYGMTLSGTATCDCTASPTDCASGSVVKSDDFPNVTLTFNSTDKRSFEPLRGEANGTQGTVIFNGGDNKTLGVRLSTYGRITICRPAGTNISGYSDSGACP
jgi:type IV fimbrial biogenesis protein FimT